MGPSGLREPAPRPAAELRVQNRYARNTGTLQVFGGVDYLERRDFYISPGVRLGATYFPWESLGLEMQISHYFSQLNQAGIEVEQMSGVVPDSRAPTWLVLVGGRYSAGYGKMMIGGFYPRDPLPAAGVPAGRECTCTTAASVRRGSPESACSCTRPRAGSSASTAA